MGKRTELRDWWKIRSWGKTTQMPGRLVVRMLSAELQKREKNRANARRHYNKIRVRRPSAVTASAAFCSPSLDRGLISLSW